MEAVTIANAETGIGRDLITAGTLLTSEPDKSLQKALQLANGKALALKDLRQTFYDRICMPYSPCYLPPYEHVFRAMERQDGVCHFPPPRHDGGRDVEAFFNAFGFRREKLVLCPLLQGAHIPGDHLGFMLLFVGFALQGGLVSTPEVKERLGTFIDRHFGPWVDDYCSLLPLETDSVYLALVAQAVSESVAGARDLLSSH